MIKENLPHVGQLKQDNKGFVFVDIDDNYIHNLVELIHAEGFEKPPYFGQPDLVRAHITVISVDEAEENNIGKIEELGMEISFTIKACEVVEPEHWENVDFVYLVTIKAPTLEKIRTKYGLTKSPYDFHITIGIHRIDKSL